MSASTIYCLYIQAEGEVMRDKCASMFGSFPLLCVTMNILNSLLHLGTLDDPTSIFLKKAELSKSGTIVTIGCVFADDFPEASCVLIYRKYNETPLTVVEYSHTTSFPVSETVECSDSERCTFSLFGKNGDDGIDREPVIRINEDISMTYQPLSGSSAPTCTIAYNYSAHAYTWFVTFDRQHSNCCIILYYRLYIIL